MKLSHYLWFGLVNGDLAKYQDGRTDTYHFELPAHSRIDQVAVNPDGSVLAATVIGLIGWKNGKQLTLTARNGLPCDIAYASISDDQGNLWIYMQCGLVEIMKAELQSWPWKEWSVMGETALCPAGGNPSLKKGERLTYVSGTLMLTKTVGNSFIICGL